MCNHYRKGAPVVGFSEVRLRLKIIPGLELAEHTYPKYPAPVVIQQNGDRLLLNKHWGLPVTIRTPKGPVVKPVTNARNDKLTGFTWRYSSQERRCLIPATGYYEPGTGKVGARGEILFTVRECPCFLIAGLWEGDAFTMVTTAPNETAARFHDRMPLVLSDADLEAWLGDQPLPPEELQRLCRGVSPDALLFEEKTAPLTGIRPTKAIPDDGPSLL
jgi:putative SOS response-associated peptidase YedK